jgi:hypothetical protein
MGILGRLNKIIRRSDEHGRWTEIDNVVDGEI